VPPGGEVFRREPRESGVLHVAFPEIALPGRVFRQFNRETAQAAKYYAIVLIVFVVPVVMVLPMSTKQAVACAVFQSA
jgi:hypothetical protein